MYSDRLGSSDEVIQKFISDISHTPRFLSEFQARSYINFVLRPEHDAGDQQAAERALRLAIAVGLEAKAVGWVLDAPKAKRRGRHARFEQFRQQRLKDREVFDRVRAICREQHISLARALVKLAEERELPDWTDKGLRKAYYRYLKSPLLAADRTISELFQMIVVPPQR